MDIFPWQGKLLYFIDIKAVSGGVVTYLSSFYSEYFLRKDT